MYKDKVSKLTLEEKALMLTGDGMSTKVFSEYEIDGVEMSDGPSGVRVHARSPKKRPYLEGGNVAFPSASTLAATWDVKVVEEVGNQLALNCLQQGVDVLLTPGINLIRNPQNGRNYEYFSEDPYLTAEMGAAYIKGMQDKGVGTSLKHFAVNHQEMYRGVVNAEVSERVLRELYLPAFEAIVKRVNPTTVMCAYNKVNGHYCSENKKLLTDILKKEWGYDGVVVSDWGAVHNTAKAISAGLDLIMPQRQIIVEEVLRQVENKEITVEAIDTAIENILKLVDRIKNMPKPKEEFNREVAHNVAYKAASEAITLLKNDGILPLESGKYKKIGVLGYYAQMPMAGGDDGMGKVTIDKKSVDTPLDWIKKLAGDTEIMYAPLYDDVGGNLTFDPLIEIQKIAKECEVLIMFAGTPPYWEVEGEDRDSLNLPVYMIRLMEECSRFCDKTIMVVQTGAAYYPFMRYVEPNALVQMWYGGEACGKAIADVLFGKVNPSGKLPMTFMREINPQIELSRDGRYIDYCDGLFVGYKYYDKHPDKIWYPFGYGLSYTKFLYSDLKIESDDNLTAKVKFKIKNVGDREGKEVCQLYVKPLENSVVRPEKELKGFDKVSLKPGEEKQVEIFLDERAFSYYNTNISDWYEESGNYGILIGASSRDIRLEGVFRVEKDDIYTINRDRWRDSSRKELLG